MDEIDVSKNIQPSLPICYNDRVGILSFSSFVLVPTAHQRFMAMLFLLEMQDEWKLKAPLLTLTDFREIFEVIMPKRRVSDREILKLIEEKHKARYSAKLSHHKRGR
jgi:hypothetical protein